MNLEKINQLEELCEQYAKAPWKTIDKRLEDDTQKWVMYQASLEDQEGRDERLQFIVDVMNHLPELLKTAKKSLQIQSEDKVTISQVKELISSAFMLHEKAKH
jgi:hypothetical protein